MGPGSFLDLRVYRDAIAALAGGEPLYGVQVTEHSLPFTYPPFAALALGAFAQMPLVVAEVALTSLTVVAVVAVSFVTIRSCVTSSTPDVFCWAVLAMGVSLLLEPFRSTVYYGQINALLMCAVTLDALVVPARHRGILCGLAAAVKLTPAVFILYFLWQRDMRAAARMVATAAVATLVGAVALPSETAEYFTATLWDTSRIGNVAFVGNQSMRGMIERASHGGAASAALWLACVICVFAALVAAGRHLERSEQAAGLSLVALFGLLASPVSWTHHWVWVLPATLAFVLRGRRLEAVAAVILALGTLLPALWLVDAAEGPRISGPVAHMTASNQFVLLTGALGVAVGLSRRARRHERGLPRNPGGRAAGEETPVAVPDLHAP